ncbi:MAG TPA: hypothetical protein VNA89_15910 [Gemmatimonadaceae bacterium]|nr:hypothetical protein [Gemmatimonadaceae bacterium]
MTEATVASVPKGLTAARVPAEELADALRRQLAADGVPEQPVVWTDGDAEAVLYPELLRLALRPGFVLLEARFATDQTGERPVPLIVPFSVGSTSHDAALVAVTEDAPRGDPVLAARWGTLTQDALWSAVLAAGADRRPPARPALALIGLYAETDALVYLFAPPVTANEVARTLGRDRTGAREARAKTRQPTTTRATTKRKTPSRASKSRTAKTRPGR